MKAVEFNVYTPCEKWAVAFIQRINQTPASVDVTAQNASEAWIQNAPESCQNEHAEHSIMQAVALRRGHDDVIAQGVTQ